MTELMVVRTCHWEPHNIAQQELEKEGCLLSLSTGFLLLFLQSGPVVMVC